MQQNFAGQQPTQGAAPVAGWLWGRWEVSVAALSKAEAKDLHQVVGAYGAGCTVKDARDFCSPGPVMTAVYTLLTAAVLLGLGVVFLPFIVMGLMALVVVPWRIATKRRRWQQLLPPEHDDALLVLV